jgi:hypothetical protein
MDNSHYFDHVGNDTIPTQPEEEDTTATDLVSDAIGEIMDNVKKAFSASDPDGRD